MMDRKPIGLTVPYREVGYKEKKEWEIKRPWVGLSEKTFAEACQMAERGNYLVAFKLIQTELKEKNT